MAKNLVLWMIIAGVLLTVFNNINRDPQADSIIYSQFVKELRDGRVQAVDIQNLQITGYRSDGSRFRSIMPAIGDRGLMDELLESNVAI
ncbi:ATP-dependent metallopeptidase FtsH/Yme1/Tma family protein, partial [Gammaproteobacteria bacterium]|nr:ATP-dependent metallopeptidase FtsH/Yme1/Tma family protein [Gammaproteobacteria bacterium]